MNTKANGSHLDEPDEHLLQLSEDDLVEMVLRLAHGIRNPLATIKSGVQLIQHLSHSTEEIAEYFQAILAEVTRIDFIVRDMQRFVQVEPLRPKELDVDGAIRDAVQDGLSEAEKERVDIAPATPVSLHFLVDGEPFKLAVTELIRNALCFSPEDSRVVVSSHIDKVGQLKVQVDDQGPGIPPEYAERVMRPFFSSSTRGTGLGLNIAARFCLRAGGRLTWKNREPRGCRFTLCLPGG